MPDTTDALRDRPDAASRSIDLAVTRALAGSVSALAFWAAIVLPVLYLPLLVTGLRSTEGFALFLGLFAVHLLALFAGRSHRRDGDA